MGVAVENFTKYIDTFLDYRETVYDASKETVKSNRIDLELFDRFLYEKEYEFITGPSVIAFQSYLKKDRKNCGGSINRKLFTLRSYSKFLELMEIEDASKLPFASALKVRQGYKNRPNALNYEQLQTLFNAIDRSTFLGIRDYAINILLYQLGLRIGEVHNLDLKDIDFNKKELTVTGKGKKRRTLHLKDEVVKILEEWIAVRSFFYKNDKTQAMFISKKGNRLSIRTMEDNFKKLVKKAKLETYFNITCHSMRHYVESKIMVSDRTE